jgi:hypothetical protein
MNYQDVAIEIDGQTVVENGRSIGRYRVRVLQSPAGETAAEAATPVEWDDKQLHRSLEKLEARELSRDDLIALGRTLAVLLLPVGSTDARASVRELFARSLALAGQDGGVRLRLRLPRELSVIPWEYAYVDRENGDGMDGFLSLDPRVAIVRHEAMGAVVHSPLLEGDIKVVAAFAAAPDLPKLDLDLEREILSDALRDVEGITIATVPDATLSAIAPPLERAGIFHFAGHGDFERRMGDRPGTYVGRGFLAFQNERVDAEQLAINLRGNGVRLAVLAGCKTARRDDVSVWSGVAPALVRAEIPAVLANQYSITDKCAVAFSRALYQSLAGGQPLERAVAAGRIAAFNADRHGRDWGVPVLYLRAATGELFGGAADRRARERAHEGAEEIVRVRTREVRAGAVVYGAQFARMLGGKLDVNVTVDGAVLGAVVGLEADHLESGHSTTTVHTGDVNTGGSVVGAKIGTVGARAGRPSGPPRQSDPATGPFRPAAPAPAPAGAAAPPPSVARSTTRVSVTTGEVHGGEVIGQQVNQSQEISQITAETVNIYQGGAPATGVAEPPEAIVEERIRLDVAVPKSATVDTPFKVFVAVKQPGTPALTATELDQVVSQEGMLFREEDDQVVRYRVEVTGGGFRVTPPYYVFRMRPKQDSPVIGFQVVAGIPGRQSLFVNAYQEEGAAPELIAQTILEIQVEIAVSPA